MSWLSRLFFFYRQKPIFKHELDHPHPQDKEDEGASSLKLTTEHPWWALSQHSLVMLSSPQAWGQP